MEGHHSAVESQAQLSTDNTPRPLRATAISRDSIPDKGYYNTRKSEWGPDIGVRDPLALFYGLLAANNCVRILPFPRVAVQPNAKYLRRNPIASLYVDVIFVNLVRKKGWLDGKSKFWGELWVNSSNMVDFPGTSERECFNKISRFWDRLSS